MDIITKKFFEFILNVFIKNISHIKQCLQNIAPTIVVCVVLQIFFYYIFLRQINISNDFDFVSNANKQFVFKAAVETIAIDLKNCNIDIKKSPIPRAIYFQYDNLYENKFTSYFIRKKKYIQQIWGMGMEDMKQSPAYNTRRATPVTDKCKEYLINKHSQNYYFLTTREELNEECPSLTNDYFFNYSDKAKKSTHILIVIEKDLYNGYKAMALINGNDLKNYNCNYNVNTTIAKVLHEKLKMVSPFEN